MTPKEWRAKATACAAARKSLATYRPASPKVMFGPIQPVNRVDEKGKTTFFAIDTHRQLKLYAAANKLLAQSGYFHHGVVDHEESLPEATMIGAFGLRPIWHGRV